MKNNDELDNKNLNDIAAGSGVLDKYLKTIVEKDKDKNMIDYGTGVQLDLNPSVDYDKNENLLIIKREKEKAEK